MPIVLAADLGTTTITALALDLEQESFVARATLPNDAETTSAADRQRGRSEWDAERIGQIGVKALREVVEQLGGRAAEVVAIGLTGQQHGGLLIDRDRQPQTPLINWQDRRGDEPVSAGEPSYIERARQEVGPDAPHRLGCRLSSGYLGILVYWLKHQGRLPEGTTACLIPEWFAAQLCGAAPVSDPTMAGSVGLMNVRRRDWDDAALEALGLDRARFAPVVEASQPAGQLTPSVAQELRLTAGIPVYPALGDNQASFVGSVADPAQTALVNVGTGGQVAAWSDVIAQHPLLETRPYPLGGNLLVCAGLCGGRTYALLESFLRAVGSTLFDAADDVRLYEKMNALAASAEPGSGGVVCDPLFTGSRVEPDRRAAWTGLSPYNLIPGNLIRSLLEGIAGVFGEGLDAIRHDSERTFVRAVGAGNGLRQNRVLADCVQRALELPLETPQHHEEACTGAALVAAVGAGLAPTLDAAAKWIRCQPAKTT